MSVSPAGNGAMADMGGSEHERDIQDLLTKDRHLINH
jgi:hypothetical protein